MSAAQRTRGANAERQVVNYLRAAGWPDARRYLAGDGRQPGDVDFHPLVCLEVKDVARSAWPTWCRQAAAEAPTGTVPAVVRRTRGVPDPGLWECRVRCWEWWCVFDEPAPELVPWVDVPHQEPEIGWVDFPWTCVTLAALVVAVRSVDTQEGQK